MKRYLITGASRGIGRAIAEKLAGPDCLLLLHGRNREALAKTCRLVEAKGSQATALSYDLRRAARVEKMIEAVGPEPLDALVNNAGIALVKPFQEITLAEWDTLFAVNVTAPFLLTQRLAPKMQAGASIVNILSIAAKNGFPGWSCYCMTKFALEGFSQCIREEVRARGIRVLNIYPAATNTEIWNAVQGEWPREKMLLPEEIGDAVAYALSRPPGVVVENIDLLNLTGRL
ncbi:MAG TPA: SDR family NAD(P)-dependent oxidoreductase [Chthoniobacterales bacterium]|nr:SDR family NAD(P)-dependent oxidoreductase [Chthoniobacterales bacterium]